MSRLGSLIPKRKHTEVQVKNKELLQWALQNAHRARKCSLHEFFQKEKKKKTLKSWQFCEGLKGRLVGFLWDVTWLPVQLQYPSLSSVLFTRLQKCPPSPSSSVLVLVLSQNGQKNKRTKTLVSCSPSLIGLCVCFFNPQTKIDTAIHSQPCLLTLSVKLQRAARPPEAKSDWNVFQKNGGIKRNRFSPNQDHQAVPVL